MMTKSSKDRFRFLTLFLLVTGLLCSVSEAGRRGYQKQLFKARDEVLPALVHVEPILEVFRSGRQAKQAVTGSGFIISDDGYVVTNSHVVQKARKVTCTLYNRQEVEAEVVGSDPLSDLAVLKFDPAHVKGDLPRASLGDSDLLEVGEFVLAMGPLFETLTLLGRETVVRRLDAAKKLL